MKDTILEGIVGLFCMIFIIHYISFFIIAIFQIKNGRDKELK